jgi:excisionase family DNA binding protein
MNKVVSNNFRGSKEIVSANETRGYYEPFFENLISEEKLLTKEDVANFLNVSIKKIDRLVSMEEIPFFKIGRNVRFSKTRVLAWIRDNNPKR